MECSLPGRLNINCFSAVRNTNPYTSRQSLKLDAPKGYSSEQGLKSIMGRAHMIWNALDDDLKLLNSKQLATRLKPKNRPDSCYAVNKTRLGSIHITRLRCGNSDLSEDLWKIKLRPTPDCECGMPKETTAHYLLCCMLYSDARVEMFGKIPETTLDSRHLATYLLNGDPREDQATNLNIIEATQDFILKTGRFNYKTLLHLQELACADN